MASPISLFLVVTVGCLVVNAAAVSEPLPSDVDRQTKQLFMAPPLSPLAGYNYYLPYGMGMPSAGGFYPFRFASWPYPLVDPDLARQFEVTARAPRETIIVNPADAECLSADVATNGLGPCTKTSGARHGSIRINLPVAEQTAVVGIVRSSNERITLRCSEMTAVNAFTKTGKIADKSVVRTETGVLQLVVSSTAVNAVMKCTW